MFENIKQCFSDLQNDIITNKQKIKLYLLLYCLIPCIVLGIFFCFANQLFANDCILYLLCSFIINAIAIIIFLPTYLILYSLFKKIQDKYARCMFVATGIPLTMFVYSLISMLLCFMPVGVIDILITLFIIGLAWLLEILPIAFIVTLFTPKKILNEKYYNLLTIFLMEIIGWVLFFITMCMGFNVHNT